LELFSKLFELKVFYKDLKATHVFINAILEITLIDFGLGEDLSTCEEGYETTSLPGGTYHAMSP